MVNTKIDSPLNKMSKDGLKQVIAQYEVLVDNLRYQILALKVQIFLETPNLQLRFPVQILEEDDSDDIPDIIPDIVDPNFKLRRRDIAYQ